MTKVIQYTNHTVLFFTATRIQRAAFSVFIFFRF